MNAAWVTVGGDNSHASRSVAAHVLARPDQER